MGGPKLNNLDNTRLSKGPFVAASNNFDIHYATTFTKKRSFEKYERLLIWLLELLSHGGTVVIPYTWATVIFQYFSPFPDKLFVFKLLWVLEVL